MEACVKLSVQLSCDRLKPSIAFSGTIADISVSNGVPYAVLTHPDMSTYFTKTAGVTWTVDRSVELTDVDTEVWIDTDGLLLVEGWVWPTDFSGWTISGTDEFGEIATSNVFNFFEAP